MSDSLVRHTKLTRVLEMGFAPERVDWALQSTNGTLEAALDHLEAHQDEAMPADAMAAAPQPTGAADPQSSEAPEVNVCTK